MSERENLKAFIQKLLELQQKEKPLSLEEMKAIAHSIGLSEADWQNVMQAFEGYLLRAKGYLKYGNWQDAIEELEQALALNPSHKEVLTCLVQAYYQKWIASRSPKDKEKALQYAERCIQIHPTFTPAYKIRSELKGLSRKNSANSLLLKKTLWIFLLILTFATAGVVSVIVTAEQKRRAIPKFIQTIPPLTHHPTPPELTTNPIFLDEENYKELEWEDSQPEGIKVAAMQRKLHVINRLGIRTSYQLTISFKNIGQKTISQLRVLFIWYDENGEEISRKSSTIIKGKEFDKLEPNQTYELTIKKNFWGISGNVRCAIKVLKAK
ncbi:MAG: tetratricopeptide repeat protein [Microscillaceae bacterium]|nr:tetratricopeptide repeat protein [Microscillaceae bacterium]MDW8461865.1 tetratricopeptide repeat protein [Cytophagales bacterium]